MVILTQLLESEEHHSIQIASYVGAVPDSFWTLGRLKKTHEENASFSISITLKLIVP